MNKHRQQHKKEELEKKWKWLGEKLSELEQERILETRAEEKLRLGKHIGNIQDERQQVEEELKSLEGKLEGKSAREEPKEPEEKAQTERSQPERWLHGLRFNSIKEPRTVILFIGIFLLGNLIGILLYQTLWGLRENLILSENVKIFTFDDGKEGWKPFNRGKDTGWTYFEFDEKSGGTFEVTEKGPVGDNCSGPCLKYSLDLESQGKDMFLKRNAIAYPVNATVHGILANVFYEPEEGYETREIRAGFIADQKIGNNWFTENWTKFIAPRKWYTLVWSLSGPAGWDETRDIEKENAWHSLEKAFKDSGDPEYLLNATWKLDDIRINEIGVQFFVYTEGEQKEFRGTAYIDNIVLIYQDTP